MNKKTTLTALLSITILTSVIAISNISPAFADPVLNPQNGHYYQYVSGVHITWTDAKIAAENSIYDGIRGHLVTITSQSENDFVAGLHPPDFRPWIGLSDESMEGTYEWVTGEPLVYTNWSPGEPSNDTNEHHVEFFGSNGKWNNHKHFNLHNNGYVIEYDVPPPHLNPDNGHYYRYVWDPSSWTDAKTAAENTVYKGVNGYLATITSQTENTFVAKLIQYKGGAWIGLTDEVTEGDYKWVTGEPLVYTNWQPNQPDNYNGNEDYVEYNTFFSGWNDLSNNNNRDGYVVEYAPDYPPVINPENGHYYQYVINGSISWTDAKAAAESSIYNGASGHLVTITSQSENDFVAGLHPPNFRPWIGLSDESREGTYQWVTGEPLVYTNWSPGEPNNFYNENYVEFFGSNDKWNNIANTNRYITGYVIEYDVPTLNPDNGHYYHYVIDDDITWTAAKTAAESRTFNGVSGHLVTITTASENDFVAGLVLDNYNFTWIGLSDKDTEGQYKWVTDEPFSYTNWSPGQPDNYNNNEDYGQFRAYDDKWNDIKNDADYINGYIVEYSY